MRRLRAGSIGSMRAWLPSRRSTEHHSGAFVMRWSGQVRSGSSSGRNGRYLSKGMRFGVTGSGGIRGSSSVQGVGTKKNLLPAAGGRRGERREGALAYISSRRSEAKVLVMSPPSSRWASHRVKADRVRSVIRRLVRIGLLARGRWRRSPFALLRAPGAPSTPAGRSAREPTEPVAAPRRPAARVGRADGRRRARRATP